MSEEAWDDVRILCFLLKIHDTLEVGTVFGLVGRSGEWDVDVFTSDPLIQVIFDLKKRIKRTTKEISRKKGQTTVSTKAMAGLGSTSFSENSGCTTPSSSLFLNQTLLIIV